MNDTNKSRRAVDMTLEELAEAESRFHVGDTVKIARYHTTGRVTRLSKGSRFGWDSGVFVYVETANGVRDCFPLSTIENWNPAK